MKIKQLIPVFVIAALLCGALFLMGATEFAPANQSGSITGVSAVIGGGFGNSGCTLSSAGAISCNNNAIIGGTTLITGTTTLNGAVAIGDGGDTVAVNSSDWDINATGDMTGIGAVTTNGLATLALGATISGATTSINNDSNFATNINTGTSNAALTLGGGSGTVAVNSSDWDITTAGVMTGIGAITADGLASLNAGIAVDSTVFTVEDATGQVVINGTADADTNNYDNMLLIDHDLVGLGTKDRVYGIDIEMSRAAGYGTTNGDHDDAGLKIRMVNKATDNTAGTTMRGIDVNVKNDNPSGAITNLSGATFTVQTDTGSPAAGDASTAYAVQGQITANAPITDSLIVADFRNFRQTATEPTIEYGVQIRNGNTTGTGIDRGLSFSSEAATVGDFGYIIDMSDAAASTADIRLSQGETIDNLTDGTVNITPAANGSLAVTTGNLKVGSGTPGVTLNGEDAYVTGTFEADGAARFDGAVTTNSTFAADGGITVDTSNFAVNGSSGAVATASSVTAAAGAAVSGGDVTLTGAANGGNKTDRNEFIGLPRIKYLGLGTGVDGTAQTVAYIDDTPTGEWAVVGATVTPTLTADTDYFKDVTNSVKIAFTDVTDNHGADGTITEDDLSGNESIGFWMYSSVATEATYFDVTLDDTDGTDQVYPVPAVAANTWTWIELDISACDANCDSVNGVQFLATEAGGTALTAANIYLDAMYKWDADAEETLDLALQTDGVLGCVKATDATQLLEYTGFFVNYQTGSDVLVYISNESSDVHACLFAY